MRRVRRWLGWVPLALIGGALLGGCGSAAKPHSTTSTAVVTSPAQPAPSLVTAQQVGAARTGSPLRAALEWWQAMQYGDTLTAKTLTSPAAISSVQGPAEFGVIVAAAGPSLPGFRPVSTSLVGHRAVVRGMELSYASPPSRRLVAQYPVTLILTDAHGRWRVDDLSVVLKLYRQVVAQQQGKAGS